MPYTPPLWDSINFAFAIPLQPLAFNFLTSPYTPPSWDTIHFDFTVPLQPLAFEFAPVPPEPISKELLLSLGLRFSGQVYKYWVCYIWRGTQRIRRYWEHEHDPSPWTAASQAKFAAGMLAWQNLSDFDKLLWRRIGVRKKKPISSHNAFLSAWMRDKIQ